MDEISKPTPALPRQDTLRQSIRSVLIGVGVNTILVVVKLLAGVFGNSYALIADAAESALDIFGSVIVYSGIVIGSKPPDEDHPYGHGKAEALATLVIALILMGVAVALTVESIREIRTPHHAPAPFTLVVLVCVVLVKEILFRRVRQLGEDVGSTVVK